jgi:hypothetical protein
LATSAFKTGTVRPRYFRQPFWLLEQKGIFHLHYPSTNGQNATCIEVHGPVIGQFIVFLFIIMSYAGSDLEGDENFSGDLSHRYPLPDNAHFIGILSRFQPLQNIIPNFDYETVIVLSGPEPQRSIFEKKMTEKFSIDTAKSLMIQGLPHNRNKPQLKLEF